MGTKKINKRNYFRIIRIVVMILVLNVPVLSISQNKKKTEKSELKKPQYLNFINY